MKDCNLEYKRVNVKLHELVHEINRFCVCEIKRKGKNRSKRRSSHVVREAEVRKYENAEVYCTSENTDIL